MNFDIPGGVRCESRNEKMEALRHFFNTNTQILGDSGILQNTHKYLYLVGEEPTGKMHVVEKVAREVYGESWASKIYIRRDEGQKFPYKLHAHKVESSAKVIFMTSTADYWNKWVTLYPTTQAIEFYGADVMEMSNSPYYMIDYSRLNQRRTISIETTRDALRDSVEELRQEGLLTEERANQLHTKLRHILKETNRQWFCDFQASQVTNS